MFFELFSLLVLITLSYNFSVVIKNVTKVEAYRVFKKKKKKSIHYCDKKACESYKFHLLRLKFSIKHLKKIKRGFHGTSSLCKITFLTL